MTNDKLKVRSTLIVRIIPQSAVNAEASFDFVELCVSDLAASSGTAASESR